MSVHLILMNAHSQEEKERGTMSSYWLGELLGKSCSIEESTENASVAGEKQETPSMLYHITMQITGRKFKNKIQPKHKQEKVIEERTEFPENDIA